MAPRLIGLDIGSFAVRAVQLSGSGGRYTFERFAQVTLPPGAVRDGEIVDVGAVAAAARRLWADGGFKGKSAVVGVANQRVIVRQADMPAMSEQDLQSALRFEAQDLIPIPIEDAILDAQILEHMVGPEGEPRMRILLAAAQREMVRTHLAGIEAAGLSASAVDVVPFALVRALTVQAPAFGADATAEAIVCIGGGVTNVVVHEHGVPRFVRVLLVGGDDITETIARDLNVDLDTAEDLKRRSDPTSGDVSLARAGQIVADRLVPLVEEIRGSLDYYSAQTQSVPIGRVLVTGGASRTRGLMERLQAQLGTRVEPAHPMAGLQLGSSLNQAQLAEIEPMLTVPIGLALAADLPKGARRITLLPREVRAGRQQQRQAMLAGVGVGALAVVLLGAWALRAGAVADEKDKAATEERRTQTLERQVSALADTTALANDIAQRRSQVQAVLISDIAWTTLFNEIATVIPNDVWLTTFSGARTGEVQISANGFDHTSVARWLQRVGDLRSLTNLWVPSASKAAGLESFSSTATLTDQARSKRLEQFLEDAQ